MTSLENNRPDIHPILGIIKKLVPGLAKVMGDDTELVLHDFGHPEDSIVAIEGNVTGRKPGAPLTDLILLLLRQGKLIDDLINYQSKGPDGKLLRSSTILIRDQKEELIGCLCINYDLTKLTIAKHLIDSLYRTSPLKEDDHETYPLDMESMLRATIEQVIERQESPVSLMKKTEKLQVIKELDKRGIFLIKRAVTRVASALDVSRTTIYIYLEQIRTFEN